MNNPLIAIIYTTFLRDELMARTIQSILNYLPKDSILLVGDQNPTQEKEQKYSNILYYKLPYDCGLSYARNYLIQKANEMEIPYILMTADSLEFTQSYDFQPIIRFLETNNTAKVGFPIINRVHYEYNMDLIPNKFFKFTKSEKEIIFEGISFKKVDICRNFFLAKTKTFIDVPYDNELKLMEHEDHCWRLKEKGYETYFTNLISVRYIGTPTEQYKPFRNRMYHEFKKLLLKKYNIVSWVKIIS